MRKKMPFNIYSIEDVEKWREDFFYPVSSGVSDLVNDRTCRFLIEVYEGIRDDLKVHFRIASKAVFIETYTLLLRLILAFKMRERGDCEFILTNQRLPEDVILKERNITFDLYKGVEDIPFPDLRLEYDDRYYHVIPLWKKLAKRVVWELKSSGLPNPGNGSRALVMGPNQLTLKYFHNRFGRTPFVIYPEFIFKMPFPYPEAGSHSGYFDSLTKSLGEWMNTLFREVTGGGGISEKILGEYRRALQALFNRITYDLEQARAFCRGFPSGVELYTGTAKHFVRVLGEAIREKGGKVIGCPHEGGLIGLHMPYLAFSEFATCDHFVCFDEREVRDYQKYSLINDIEFTMVPDLGESILNMEVNRLKRGTSVDLSKVSTIMYLNYSYWYDNFAYGTRSDLQGLDFQLRLIEVLLTLGKNIVFKLRPKTAYLSKHYDHFGYFQDRVEYTATPFTEMLDEADLFILEGLGSTALYEAMTLTTTPILLFKPSVPRCTPELENMLRKRCHVIDLYEDERNRLSFDQSSLREVLGYPTSKEEVQRKDG